jgi:hypothetical protein
MNEQTLKLLEDPEGFIRSVLEREPSRAAPPAADLLDDATRQAVQEQILLSHKTYLTRKEAAKYLNVSDRSVAEWSARPPDQNPFPEENAGGEPRYRRAAIDEWTRREKQRQRLKVVG